MEPASIELTQIRKSFLSEGTSNDVISNVSCRFHTNKITAIVGKSGCGKSTLLKLINGLERPDSGSIAIFGEAINYQQLEQLRHQIGYSVQGTGLFPHLSIRENICLLPDVLNWPISKTEQRLNQLLKLVDLDPTLLNRYPHQISGGQQQRVGLSRAMILDPKILLFDEAFAAVDPLTRQEIHSKILQLQANNPKTIIMVTHDLQEASLLADFIMVLHNGNIATYTKTSELFDKDDSANSITNTASSESLMKWLT